MYAEDAGNDPLLVLNRASEHSRLGDRPMPLWAEWLLFFVIGLGGWVGVNGAYLQLPILVQELPEKEGAAALLLVAVQAANVAVMAVALIGTAAQHYLKIADSKIYRILCGERRYWSGPGGALAIALTAGSLSSIFLCFAWNKWIINQNFSLGLFTGAFAFGCVGAVSVITMFPLAASEGLSPSATTAISLGTGSNAVVAAVVAIVQQPGAGDAQRFSLCAYFAGIAGICFVSLVALGVVLFMMKSAQLNLRSYETVTADGRTSDHDIDFLQSNKTPPSIRSGTDVVQSFTDPLARADRNRSSASKVWRHARLVRWASFNQAASCFLYFAWLGLAPFAVRIYSGSSFRDAQLLMWVTVSGLIANSVGRALVIGVLAGRPRTLLLINSGQTALWIYLFVAAIIGRSPMLPSTLAISGWDIMIVGAIFSGINGYQNTALFHAALHTLDDIPDHALATIVHVGRAEGVGASSFVVSIGNQAGSLIGSLTSLAMSYAL